MTAGRLAPTPAPGITVPGVNVPIPGEQDAVDTAVQNGGILALVIVVVCVGLFAGWLWRSMAVRVAGALVLGGTLVYLVTKGS